MSDYAARAAAIVAELSLDERIGLLSGRDFWTTEALLNHGLPATLMTDGPHGLRKQASEADHIGIASSLPATCFPTAALLASTWDPELARQVGAAVGAEAASEDVALVLGPGLNLKRHPAGGRNFEYFSEDPLLSGTLAGALAAGIQSQGVGACLKHYAVNNQESDRFRVDTIIDERTERELYLRGFEIAVRASKPWSVMSSYNRVRGKHVGESVRHIEELLRGEFGFDGMVVSDWLAVSNRAEAVRAGLDLEMPSSKGTWDAQVRHAVARGDLPQEHVDAAASNVVAFMLRAAEARASRGLSPDQSPTPLSQAQADDHDALARRVAARGSVLLTNDGILPLADAGGLAIIGAFAEQPRYQGAGSSLVNPRRLTSALDAFAQRGIDVAYAPGYDPRTGEVTEATLADALAMAGKAGTVLLLVGLPAVEETEGLDRHHLRLPAGMDRLAEAVIAANPRTVVAVSAGAPLQMPWAEDAAALLFSYLGGQASGAALVDVVLGDVEPAGRLAESFPFQAADLPAEPHFAKHPTQVEHRETLWVGYRFHDTWGVPARFPFGHGLGYASFEFSGAKAAVDGRAISASVTVSNTSAREGTAVVQVYAHAVASAVQRPEQALAGFATVTLAPGASATVQVPIDIRSLEVFDVASGAWALEAGDYELRFAASSTDVRERVVVSVASADAVTPGPRTAGPIATDQEFAALLGAPIPTPLPLLPFHDESTFADLRSTWAGRLLLKAVARQVADAMGDADDEIASTTAAAYMDGMPMRVLAMASEGAVSLRTMRAITALLNVLAGPRAWRRSRAPKPRL